MMFKKKLIVKNRFVAKLVTIFAVIFFLLCFAMIAFTLRWSERIDAQSKLFFGSFDFCFSNELISI